MVFNARSRKVEACFCLEKSKKKRKVEKSKTQIRKLFDFLPEVFTVFMKCTWATGTLILCVIVTELKLFFAEAAAMPRRSAEVKTSL